VKSVPKIVFLAGGMTQHPCTAQARLIVEWLGSSCQPVITEGADAFDHLADADLFVAMGLHWSGMAADWAGGLEYVPPTNEQRMVFRDYVSSGRPVIAFHGGIASFDDWPEFGRLLGYRWDWKVTAHSPLGDWAVKISETPHPITANVSDYELFDELYFNIQLDPEMAFDALAWAPYRDETERVRFPMILAGEGGRIPGAGKSVYLANGHDLRAFECGALKTVWSNTVLWLTENR